MSTQTLHRPKTACRHGGRRDQATSRIREAKAVQLAAEGLGYDAIAEQVGYADRSGAFRAVKRALDRNVAVDAELYRSVNFARLERMVKALMPKVDKGDVTAMNSLLRVIAEEIKLLGLDKVLVGTGSDRPPPELFKRVVLTAADREWLEAHGRPVG